MTQKGSRSIVVDGVSYRWMVRPKPTYMQEVFACPMTFAVVADGKLNTTLWVVVGACRPETCKIVATARTLSITPAIVAEAIRMALQQGWQAQQTGPSFELCLILDSELLMKA